MKKEKFKQRVSVILFSSFSAINLYLAFSRQDDGKVNLFLGLVFGLGAIIIIAAAFLERPDTD